MRISVIVPVYNGARELSECLGALHAQADADVEIIVVDDASTDESSTVAGRLGARLVRLDRNRGPAAARNRGARVARGEILFFVDSDVVLAPSAMTRVANAFASSPGLAAIFGSYDATPEASGLVSQYRNLLHHYTHQNGNPDAFTFWSGCGAVRRAVFDSLGGFDERSFWSAIEDVELGYRLRRNGHHIRLDRALQGRHLKRWTLGSLIRTDIAGRAVPWGRLILRDKIAPPDLNLRPAQRWSVVLLGVTTVALFLAPAWPWTLWIAAAAISGIIALSRAFYRFLREARGLGFALACVPLHLLYFACGAIGFSYAWAEVRIGRLVTR